MKQKEREKVPQTPPKEKELKTLKDIEIFIDEGLPNINEQGFIHRQIHKDRLKLRQEAIKWHKRIKENKFPKIEGWSCEDVCPDVCPNVLRFIKRTQ